jgi:glycosyltransferase involved in cell wall biosynthesis
MPARLRTVAYNAMFLDPGRSGGPETYLRQLVPAIARERPDLRIVVATTQRGARALIGEGWQEFAEVLALPADEGQRARRTFAEQVLLPRRARRDGWDLLHSLANLAPVRAGVPSVITLHDVIFITHHPFGLVTTFGMRQIVERTAPRADGLIAISAAARDEICAVLGLDPSSVAVVPHGAGRDVRPDAPSTAWVRNRYGLDGARVVLCVAAKRPHKNQEALIRAAPHLADDVVIVLAGHPEPYDAYLRQLAAALRIESRVRFVDYVPDAELEALWQMAGCAAFPTLAEGFGLPVIEAMVHGVPVACSDIPVLREVGGNLPHYFDPGDSAAVAEAVTSALEDRETAAAGRERADQFTWEAAASGTLAAYEEALARSERARARAIPVTAELGLRELWLLDPAPIMGGGQAFVLKLARYVAEHEPRRNVRLLCPPDSELAARANAAGIQVEPAHFPDLTLRSPSAIAKAALATRRLLTAAGPDVVVVTNHVRAHAFAAAVVALARHPPPLVFVAHEQESAARPSTRFLCRRFDALVAIGANAAATYGRALPRVEVRGVNNFLLSPDGDRPVPPPGGHPPVLGMLARMIPEKGIAELIDELAAHPGAWRNLRVAAALQDPDYVEMVRERVSVHGVSERVELLGEVADVPGFLASIDVMVMPSVGNECQPTAILEALERGRPVVVRAQLWSSDFEGLPVVPYRNSDDLGEALQRASARPVPPWDELEERFGPRQALEGIEAAASRIVATSSRRW